MASGSTAANNNFGELLPAAISGYVYIDANNNGVMDSGEAPITGVTLTLSGHERPGRDHADRDDDDGHRTDRTASAPAAGHVLGDGDAAKREAGRPGRQGRGGDCEQQHDGRGVGNHGRVGQHGGEQQLRRDRALELGGLRLLRRQQQRHEGQWRGGHRRRDGDAQWLQRPGRDHADRDDDRRRRLYSFANLRPGHVRDHRDTAERLPRRQGHDRLAGRHDRQRRLQQHRARPERLRHQQQLRRVAAFELGGLCLLDANNNGMKDSGEAGIASATVTLSGSNDLGAITPIVMTTDRRRGSTPSRTCGPGTYAITETQPSGYSTARTRSARRAERRQRRSATSCSARMSPAPTTTSASCAAEPDRAMSTSTRTTTA